jgi:hypothetical protein
MKSIVNQLPPEIARQIHPDRRKNEMGYWAVRDQLLDQYRGQWIGRSTKPSPSRPSLAQRIFRISLLEQSAQFLALVRL